MMPRVPIYDQRMGSEYGGVSYSSRVVKNTVQPKPAEALSVDETVRLMNLTGREWDTMSLEDRRQFVGLRNADGRPSYFVTGQPFGPTYGEAWQVQQAIIDANNNWL